MDDDLCMNCAFKHACCLGTPKYSEWAVDSQGILNRVVIHCDAFCESSESKIENP